MQELLRKRIALKDALERDKTPKNDFFGAGRDVPGSPTPNDVPLTLGELTPLPGAAAKFRVEGARLASVSVTHIGAENIAFSGSTIDQQQGALISNEDRTADLPPYSLPPRLNAPKSKTASVLAEPAIFTGPPKSMKVVTTNDASSPHPRLRPTPASVHPGAKSAGPSLKASKRTVPQILGTDPTADIGGAATRLMMFGHQMQMMAMYLAT
ncbi:hypothetical protein B0H17DRAFT_1208480 [Mycena rosella]|uniref:Uncharacterized protein n=1 Tax=Mycena rosella TaxID=1033263 RepID=A0AAD7D190_MYCRO|nr:hypothetical protein B0H17DRAFT_1208480 [Mycena rosella]